MYGLEPSAMQLSILILDCTLVEWICLGICTSFMSAYIDVVDGLANVVVVGSVRWGQQRVRIQNGRHQWETGSLQNRRAGCAAFTRGFTWPRTIYCVQDSPLEGNCTHGSVVYIASTGYHLCQSISRFLNTLATSPTPSLVEDERDWRRHGERHCGNLV